MLESCPGTLWEQQRTIGSVPQRRFSGGLANRAPVVLSVHAPGSWRASLALNQPVLGAKLRADGEARRGSVVSCGARRCHWRVRPRRLPGRKFERQRRKCWWLHLRKTYWLRD